MAKNVSSKDTRKPGIVSALKALSRGRAVTMVKEVTPGVFEGNCLGDSTHPMRRFSALGRFRVQEVKNALGIVTHYVPANAEVAGGVVAGGVVFTFGGN